MLHKIFTSLLLIIRIQIFMTLVSLPILVWWGLPVSSLSIIGNIIFAPILSIFLLLSSIIFFLELAYLPNSWVIYLLEKVTAFWLVISPPNPKSYLLLFPQTTWLIFIIALVVAIYILVYWSFNKKYQSLILGTILITSCALAKLPFWTKKDTLTLFKRKNRLEISYQSGKLVLHDYGTLNQTKGFQNWLNFTLTPTLIKNFGTIQVKDLYLNKPNQSAYQNLELLKQALIVEQIYPC